MISKEVIIGSNPLTLKEIEGILFNKYKISLSDKAVKAVSDSYQFLINFSKGKLIYGINTGFGPMAQYKIGEENLKKLQYNLIRSHCAGTGELLTDLDTKALMIARLNSLMLGYSGVHTDLVNLLMQLINKNVFPLVYQHGGVGASGDLVQLAHLALALIGEGQVKHKGSIINTDLLFKKEKLKALSIYKREGIAVLNGTSAMTGIGCINLIYSKKLLNWAIILSTLINEIAEAYDDHFSKELNQVKRHDGQNYVANKMRILSQGSQLIKRRSEVLYNKQIDDPILIDKVQEYYSLRCVPQILGPIFETILKAEEVLINEINSVNDNPIIDKKNKDVYHGGNFHGDYVALEMDKLKIAITKLSMLSERQLNYLLNDKLNQKLTPFLNLGTLGLNYGLQGMQFTATSTVAESQTLSMPNYIHSIPNNNDNQDIVSMGTNGSLLTRKVIENAFEVLAIHTIAVMQAIDVIDCSKKLSPKGLSIYKSFRKVCSKTIEDKPLSSSIGTAIIFLKESNLTDI